MPADSSFSRWLPDFCTRGDGTARRELWDRCVEAIAARARQVTTVGIGLALLPVIAAFCFGAEDALEPRFPAPPRLATTADELAAWKAGGEFETRRTAACAKAEALLREGVQIPDGWGNWIFYYACSDDGTSLEPQSLTEHRCPRCSKVFTDERTIAAYRTVLHNRADQAALDLGWAYALSADERFAQEVRRILMTYADAYPKYPARRDRWGREGILATIGGRRYCQSLDEAVGIISLAKAYDLTRSSAAWSAEDRKNVEEGMFQTVADVLLVWNYGIINHQTWYNAGLMAIANVNADADLATKVVTMMGGYRDQLGRAIGPDGMWREGTMAYHGYALQAMEELVDAGRKLGLDLHKKPGLKKMFEFPALYAWPNGQFPAINDSDPLSLASFESHFRWAWRTFGDEAFAQACARGDAQKLAELLGPARPPAETAPPGSCDLPGAGVVVLRQGRQETAACAMLDYGEHGGGHGHPDKLQLLLFAGGREWLLDPGRLDYSHREHKTWYRQTAAHNTVAIDGRSQAPCTGTLLWLERQGLRNGDAACSAECRQAYADTTLRRSLWLDGDCLIDLYAVESQRAKTVDWLIHANADSAQVEDAEPTAMGAPLGETDGYEHFTDAKRWQPADQNTLATFAAGNSSLRVWLAADQPEEIYTAKCPGYSLEPRIPCLLRRVAGGKATILAVYDWSAADRRIVGASLSPDGSISVQRATGTTTVRFGDGGLLVQQAP